MTSTRPGQGGSPYGEEYGERAAFEAAVDGLADPLSDPLPGQHPSPWFRAAAPAPPAAEAEEPQEEWYDPQGYERDWYGEQGARGGPHGAQGAQGRQGAYEAEPGYEAASGYESGSGYAEDASYAQGSSYGQDASYAQDAPSADDTSYTEGAYADPFAQAAAHRPPLDASAYEALYDRTGPIPTLPTVSGGTVSLGATAPPAVSGETVGLRPRRDADDETVGLRTSDTRRATGDDAEPRLSRLEARRAERAKRPSPAVLASRALGEVFISIGVLMLLFVTYQLWWTNIRAEQQASAETEKLQENWASGKGKPGAFEPGEGFAIMHIPKLDVVVPIAEGISKSKVLDRGMVGHYGEDSIKTAMPEDEQGNFAVAGHRNTHGEPFRYINKLKPGDPIVVETKDTYYVYKMASILPQTTPDNIAVLNPVPKGSGFTKPGRYITLTTCTPEFTSTYRMIVWGKLAEERPRDKGKPPSLVQ